MRPPTLPRVVSDPTRPRKTTKELFINYCIRCHSGDANSQPPGLPLTDFVKLKSYIGSAQRTVREVIDPIKPLMPPLGSPQPSKEEFEQMHEEMLK